MVAKPKKKGRPTAHAAQHVPMANEIQGLPPKKKVAKKK